MTTMSSKWEVGTLLVDAAGNQRVITRITPAGAAGTRVSDGPIFHATVARDGKAIQGGHTADIWNGAVTYPASDFTAVDHPRDD